MMDDNGSSAPASRTTSGSLGSGNTPGSQAAGPAGAQTGGYSGGGYGGYSGGGQTGGTSAGTQSGGYSGGGYSGGNSSNGGYSGGGFNGNGVGSGGQFGSSGGFSGGGGYNGSNNGGGFQGNGMGSEGQLGDSGGFVGPRGDFGGNSDWNAVQSAINGAGLGGFAGNGMGSSGQFGDPRDFAMDHILSTGVQPQSNWGNWSSNPVTGAFQDTAAGLGTPQNYPGMASPAPESPLDMTYGADAIEGFPQGTMASLIGRIEDPSWDPHAKNPHSSAAGLTQMLSGTQKQVGVSDPYDPAQSIFGGANYLGQQVAAQGGDLASGLGSYFAGPGNFASQGFNYKGPGGQPTAGQYADRVMGGIPGYGQSAPVSSGQFAGPGASSSSMTAPGNWPGRASEIPSPMNQFPSNAHLNPQQGQGDGEWNGAGGFMGSPPSGGMGGPGWGSAPDVTPQQAPSSGGGFSFGGLIPDAVKQKASQVGSVLKSGWDNLNNPLLGPGYQAPDPGRKMADLLAKGVQPKDAKSLLASAKRKRMADNLTNWNVTLTPGYQA
jgi:hypothetical protein